MNNYDRIKERGGVEVNVDDIVFLVYRYKTWYCYYTKVPAYYEFPAMLDDDACLSDGFPGIKPSAIYEDDAETGVVFGWDMNHLWHEENNSSLDCDELFRELTINAAAF